MSNTQPAFGTPEFGCICGYLLREDRDYCPIHGKEPLPQRPRISVGRTTPLWEEPTASTALSEIEQMVERAYFDGRITSGQRSLFLWAVRKSREAESSVRCSRCAQSLDGVEEL